ncbi:hypothetical protein H6775_03005 [Candidatus Nomurabacteria bacterium]|nr:hypothetical protein [Candidatus Nomurabacteria bacterium]
MEKIKEYKEEASKTAIGFYNHNKSDFYKICGFSILENGKDRFDCLNK